MTPLGLALHNARLEASLSVDEVAGRLNLGRSAVRDLEGDITALIESGKYAPIYLRGYLANYAKLVALKSIDEFAEYQQLAKSPKPESSLKATASAVPAGKKKLIPLWFVFILLVIAVAVGIVNQFGLLSTGSSASIETEALSENNLNEGNKAFNPLPIGQEESPEVENVTTISSAEEQTADEQNETLETIEYIDSAEPLSNREITPIVIDEAGGTEQRDTTADVTEVIADAQPAQQKTSGSELLTLSFVKDCWTEINDATGKRLAFGLYKEDFVLAIEGVAPFKVKLGDPSAVAINYQGKSLDRAFVAGRTANFYIPE
ncbi:RodZ domain-containing protein [Psychromonas sp.]|uniref:RodZ domain-containing protein n=1 Tax=Psychromonas sp. TaxID=1884585 RepID=UPI003567A903